MRGLFAFLLLQVVWLATAAASVAKAAWTAEELQQVVNWAMARGAPWTLSIPAGNYYFHHSNLDISNAHHLSMIPQGNVTLWFSGDAGINITHSHDVQLGGGLENKDNKDNHNVITIDYDPRPPSRPTFHETSGITLQLYNCTRILVQDVTIRAAPFMAVTAFQGGGDHTFQRLTLEPRSEDDANPNRTSLVALRDALHFSDLRKGPTIVNSIIGYTGDDFFNVHSTLLLVLECHSSTTIGIGTRHHHQQQRFECLLVNPRVMTDAPRNTVYGTFSVFPFVVPGDVVSFFAWPATDMILKPLVIQGAIVEHLEDVSPTYAPKAQSTLPAMLEYPPTKSWHEATNQTTKFAADEVWKVTLTWPNEHGAAPLPPVGTLVTMDTIASAGAKILHNTFLYSRCNLGRFKSPQGILQGNTFRQAWNANLELTALPQWFEGPVQVRDILIADNVFVGEGLVLPVHCGPLCEMPECHSSCDQCPSCHHDTPWATNITLRNNTIVSSQPKENER